MKDSLIKISLFYVIKFLRIKLLACRHAETNSLRLFKVDNRGLQIMKYFSHMHKLHLLVAGSYGFAFFRIFQVVLYLVLLSFNSQIYLLKSALDFLLLFLNEHLWLLNLVLMVLAVRPM